MGLTPFIVFYVYAIHKLYKFRGDFEKSIELEIRFKLFFQRWRPGCWYWGLCFVCRQISLACSLMVSDHAAVQALFVATVLGLYTVPFVFLRPWRLLEINVLEGVLTSLLIFIVVSSLPSKEFAAASAFHSFCFVAVILMCIVSVAYAFRCLLGIIFSGGIKGNFKGLFKTIDDATLMKCFDELNNSKISDDAIVQGLTEEDCEIFKSFFIILQEQSCSQICFPLGKQGARVYVPALAACDASKRQAIKQKLDTRNESYI